VAKIDIPMVDPSVVAENLTYCGVGETENKPYDTDHPVVVEVVKRLRAEIRELAENYVLDELEHVGQAVQEAHLAGELDD
jgi:hypothetical protein